MNPLIELKALFAGQMETTAKLVSDAFEKNVYIGVITLETIAIVVLFTLLMKSNKDSKIDLAKAHADHAEAMKQRSIAVATEFKEKDDKMLDTTVKIIEVAKDVTNSIDRLTERLSNN